LFLRKPISGTRPKFRTKRKPPVSEVYFWLDKPERNRSILDSTRATRWLRSKLNQGAVDDQGDPSTCLLLGINRGSLFLLNLGVALIATSGHGLASPHADTTTSGVRAVDVSKLSSPCIGLSLVLRDGPTARQGRLFVEAAHCFATQGADFK
jgi:hypothetical protein